MRIIAFGNSRYKRIAHNWALYLYHHGIDNYIVYSLDRDIYDYLHENKINTELLPMDMFQGEKYDWRGRVKFIANLLNEGVDVLHSDLDAIWLKTPLKFIENDYDIVASTGTYPIDIFQRVGYTLCMGWIYYKSSTVVKGLLKTILGQSNSVSFDDQVEFNREIFNNENKWKNLKLKTLDESIISRATPHNKNTYVAHPLSPKHTDREKFLKSKDIWILK